MNVPILSRLLVTAICLAAVAGWAGVKVEVTPAGPAPQRQSHDGTHWNPQAGWARGIHLGVGREPMVAGATTAAADPAPVVIAPRLLDLPPTSGSPLAPALQVAPPAAQVPPVPPVVPFAGGFIPLSQTLTREALDAALDGAEPELRGQWREVRFFSPALGREMTYLAWLPPGYDPDDAAGAGATGAESAGVQPSDGGRHYPTLYFLHGLNSRQHVGKDEWRDYGVGDALDRLLALRLTEPMIVILPEGEQGYWINHAGGGPRWADYVAQDVVGHVDATFRTAPARERRAVGGLSMGAHGALQLALNYPHVFGVVGSHAPTLRSYEKAPQYFGDPSWFARYDPLTLAQTAPAARRIYTWLDVGHLDTWRMGVERLRQALTAQGAPLEYRVLEGEHQNWYWATYLPEFLRFYSRALSAQGTTPEGAPDAAGAYASAAAMARAEPAGP